MTSSIRKALRASIIRAMKDRDRGGLAAYRSALAAIDNAEAIDVAGVGPAGAIEASAVGVGRAEAPRRVLSEDETVALVAAEAAERRAAADALAATAPDRGNALRAEADLLQSLVDDARAAR